MSDAYLIKRLQQALEMQDNTEGEIVSTPQVEYCLECDEITVDEPTGCVDHPTVMSDGYEHAGIQAALTVLLNAPERPAE